MPRLRPLDPTELSAEQKQVYEAIASSPRGGVRGPLAVWLRQPQFADRAQALGRYCRYDSSLPPRLSELAILVTARIWESEYEWWAHKPHALKAGISEAVVEAIRTNAEPTFERDDEAVVHEVARTLHRDRRLSDALYGRAVATLGEDRLIDLVGLLGYYALISMTINTFEIDPPADAPCCFDASSTPRPGMRTRDDE
jgi:4-carboxymuconolactone decarboxylase